MDAKRKVVDERVVKHTGAAIAELATWLTTLGDPKSTAVAIETPHGAVVEMLMERGFAVFHLNPKQLDRFRDRHRVSGVKNDRLDAFVLGDSLRTDQPSFHRVVMARRRLGAGPPARGRGRTALRAAAWARPPSPHPRSDGPALWRRAPPQPSAGLARPP